MEPGAFFPVRKGAGYVTKTRQQAICDCVPSEEDKYKTPHTLGGGGGAGLRQREGSGPNGRGTPVSVGST